MVSSAMRAFLILGFVPYMLTASPVEVVSAEQACSADGAQCPETKASSLLQSRTHRGNRGSGLLQSGSPGTAIEATVEPFACDEVTTGNGKGYRGCQTATLSGRTCQQWDAQSPHGHSRTPTNYPDSGLEENYCRNPDSEPTIWCYTTDGDKRWEYCDPLTTTTTTTTTTTPHLWISAPLPCDEENTGDGVGYRGCQAETQSGRTCQRWDAQSPHAHSRTATNYPDNSLEENYCRNPDGEPSIWCYTTDGDSRWEYCDSVQPPPPCNEVNIDNGAGYRGCQMETLSGRTCQQWDAQSPHSHSRTPTNYPDSGLEENYCRNPDGEYTIWCYTTDGDSRWEFCAPWSAFSSASSAVSPSALPPCDETNTGDGEGYRGCQTETQSGRTCQQWDAQSPHGHSRTPTNYPDSGLEENYCRNPDSEPSIWCYTTDGDKRWEYCDPVPPCDEMKTGNGKEYRGCQTETVTGKICQPWDAQSPHSHSRTPTNYPDSGLEENYCRNPDGEYSIWCYTSEADSRWEFCAPLSASSLLQSASPGTATEATVEPFACDEVTTGNGKGYRGCQTATLSGRTCQQWDAQSPHGHSRTPTNYPDSGLEENYCRNPDSEPSIWCYTTDGDKRWEYCEPLTTTTTTTTTTTPHLWISAPLPCDEENTGDGVGYRGCQAETQSGRTCQRWDAQSPHAHSRTATNYPDNSLEENYCRNPDGEPSIWCYTTDGDSRWEYCDSVQPPPPCNEVNIDNGAGYRGCQMETLSGRTCQQWDAQSPHSHSRTPTNYPDSGLEENYCRNPDGEYTIWCYTTDGDSRWEFCAPWSAFSSASSAVSPSALPPCDETNTGDGEGYRGCQTETQSGRTCQRWDAQSPHGHSRTPTNYPDSGLEENYCRNPDGEPSIWCYTIDGDKRWEYCDPVPPCDETKTGNGKEYRGCQTETVTGKICQQWDAQSPHSHSRTPANYPDSGLEENYCRNPDGEYSIWCYTSEADSRWEFCAPL